LQIQPLKIEPRKIPGLQPLSANIQLMFEIIQIVVSKLLRLRDNEIRDSLPHRKNSLLSCAWY